MSISRAKGSKMEWQTDRHDEANSRFSQFSEHTYLRASLRIRDTNSQKIICGHIYCGRKIAEQWKARRCWKRRQEQCLSHVTSRCKWGYLMLDLITCTLMYTVSCMNAASTIHYVRILYCKSRSARVRIQRRVPLRRLNKQRCPRSGYR